MTHVLPTGSKHRRGVVLAAIVAALLSAATYLAVAPSTASAATGTCDPGDFCLWYYSNYSGGLYEFNGSDSTLANDHFENANTDQIVADNTMSVWNRGVSDPSGLVDVVAYSGTGYSGAGLCVRQGRKANLPSNWDNNIASYRWVTPATCSGFPQL